MVKISRQAVLAATGNPVIAYSLHGNCYLNVTNRCSLRCAFCPKFNGSWDVQDYNLRLPREPSVASILLAAGDPSRYQEVVFCGLGEPTLRLYEILEVAQTLRRKGARRFRLNTDGLANLVQGHDITPNLEGCIDALSVSLNAHNEKLYEQHCRPQHPGSFQAVLDFVSSARQFVPDITITAIQGLEGVDIAACEKIAAKLGVKFRERTLDQVG